MRGADSSAALWYMMVGRAALGARLSDNSIEEASHYNDLDEKNRQLGEQRDDRAMSDLLISLVTTSCSEPPRKADGGKEGS
jgi:hypothetical protein